MAVDLEALDEVLNTTSLALLGDTITYTPEGGAPLTLKAIVDHSDGEKLLSNSRVMTSEAAVEVAISDVPQPKGGDVIHLPKPGQDFNPKNFEKDKSGMNWLILLKRVPS
jgi:hypothetical protein